METAITATSNPSAGKGLRIGLWIAQVFIFAMFLLSGS
jgi:hypothetical protein